MLLALISFSRCEKTDFGESVFFGILTRFQPLVSPFMIAHIVKALQVFLHSVWIKMFWTERRASATDQGMFHRWQVKAPILTRLSPIKPPLVAARGDKRKRNKELVLWDWNGGVKPYSQRRAARKGKRQNSNGKRPKRCLKSDWFG